jgi:hypothetical protein
VEGDIYQLFQYFLCEHMREFTNNAGHAHALVFSSYCYLSEDKHSCDIVIQFFFISLSPSDMLRFKFSLKVKLKIDAICI